MKNLTFYKEFKQELLEIDYHFHNYLNSWWEDIYNYTYTLEEDLLWQSIPEFVLLAYDYFGVEQDLSIKMAVIFKMVYLSNHIHAHIKDDEEGQAYNQELQFTILIGDYLFGQIMKLLLEVGAVKVVDAFTDMMGEISEGYIIKNKIDASAIEVLEKTEASYYSTAFFTAARLSGITSERDLILIKELGLSLGMIMYLILNNRTHNEINDYMLKINQLYNLVNHNKGNDKSFLPKAIIKLNEFLGNQSKAAVI